MLSAVSPTGTVAIPRTPTSEGKDSQPEGVFLIWSAALPRSTPTATSSKPVRAALRSAATTASKSENVVLPPSVPRGFL